MEERPRKEFEFYFNQEAFKIYKSYDESKKNLSLKTTMEELEQILFGNNAAEAEYILKGIHGERMQVIDVEGFTTLASKIMKSAESGNCYAELTHLSQVVDFFGSSKPILLDHLAKKIQHFDVHHQNMSKSNHVLANLDNIWIYLNERWKHKLHASHWVESIFDQPISINQETSPLEELKIFSNYIKHCEKKIVKNIQSIRSHPRLTGYWQHELITNKLNFITTKIVEWAAFYPRRFSQKSFIADL